MKISFWGLSSSSQPGMKERPINVTRRSDLIRTLATLGVLALIMLLLVWGFWAMQWTILTTNNNVRDAIATSSVISETATYSIPQGTQKAYPICIDFQASSSGASCRTTGSIPSVVLNTPVSNLSTTVDDYVVFTITNPNGSALTVWYTGPQGNLTQDCHGTYPAGEITCPYEPTPTGFKLGVGSTFFKTPTPGNYSIHLLSTQCTSSPNYCSTTTAVGSLSIALSSLTYNRPYWAYGLATAIVAGASIATIAYVGIVVHRRSKQRGRQNPHV